MRVSQTTSRPRPTPCITKKNALLVGKKKDSITSTYLAAIEFGYTDVRWFELFALQVRYDDREPSFGVLEQTMFVAQRAAAKVNHVHPGNQRSGGAWKSVDFATIVSTGAAKRSEG
jgi:hypothetical protein